MTLTEDDEERAKLSQMLWRRCGNCHRNLTGYDVTGPGWNWVTPNFGPFCNRADGDGDGWNDTLEQGIADLTEPAVVNSTDTTDVLGVDYLAGQSLTTTTNDEVDSYPPDVNDDGNVTQADVQAISAWVGRGTGVPLAHVDYTGTDAYRLAHSQRAR